MPYQVKHEYQDFLGNEIKIGSEVVYPGRQGSNLWMNYGTVEKLGEFNWSWRDKPVKRILVRRVPMSMYEKERLVWVTTLGRVVVVK